MKPDRWDVWEPALCGGLVCHGSSGSMTLTDLLVILTLVPKKCRSGTVSSTTGFS